MTTTTSPLDTAILARNDAALDLEKAHRVLDWAKQNRRGFTRGPGVTAAYQRQREAEARVEAAVAAYDAAGVALDAAIAARPDLRVCTCGHPECEYAA